MALKEMKEDWEKEEKKKEKKRVISLFLSSKVGLKFYKCNQAAFPSLFFPVFKTPFFSLLFSEMKWEASKLATFTT